MSGKSTSTATRGALSQEGFSAPPLNLLQSRPGIANYYFYREALSPAEIERIRALVPPRGMRAGNVSGTIDASYRSSRISWIPRHPDSEWLYQKLVAFVRDANEQMWQFHLTNLLEEIQFTEYDADYEGHYDWHMDVGGVESSTRKLSMTIQLSDPGDYEGGELQFLLNRNVHETERSQGTVVLFPSYLLHRVNRVTRGRRQSLVLWIHGPPFQ